tara:strand:- start:679 stop:1209 length:531 start_codon:yes stop_codon:yes gene_type:complete
MTTKRKKIEKDSEELLRQFNLLSTPVKIESLAEKLGISVIYEDLDDNISGFLVKKEGKNIIGVNESHHIVRKRFTIAHEIGHYSLHFQTPLFVDYYKGSMLYRSNNKSRDYNKEKEANSYAAGLLMPQSLIDKELSNLPDNMDYEDKIYELKRIFQVSTQAMDYRLKSLGYYDYGF